jgi:hypothetical protein
MGKFKRTRATLLKRKGRQEVKTVLDLKGGGNATLGNAGDSRPCTYSVSGNQTGAGLQGDGDKEKLVFTIHQDGSLTTEGFHDSVAETK